MSFLNFLLGLALGAMYSPIIKPLLLSSWAKIKAAINKQPKDPTPLA